MAETPSPPAAGGASGATDSTTVVHWGKLRGDDAAAEVVEPVVAAVNHLVAGWCGLKVGADGDLYVPAPVHLGATMLAARLVSRRSTADGMVVMGSDAIGYVQKRDPDVAMLLGLGEHGKPAVG